MGHTIQLHRRRMVRPSIRARLSSSTNASSPCLVANLWDVTDKDIDRFSLEMLTRWSLISSTSSTSEHEAVSICAAVAQSRDECNLQYLNGAAPVVYGLPLKLSKMNNPR